MSIKSLREKQLEYETLSDKQRGNDDEIERLRMNKQMRILEDQMVEEMYNGIFGNEDKFFPDHNA